MTIQKVTEGEYLDTFVDGLMQGVCNASHNNNTITFKYYKKWHKDIGLYLGRDSNTKGKIIQYFL